MITTLRNALACTLFSIANLTANAQQVNLKYAPTEVIGPKHALQLAPGGDYMMITWHFADNEAPFIVSRIDPQSLTARYTNTLQEFSLQHYQASMYADNRLFVITTNKEGAVSRYEINDKNGKLIGSPAVLFNMEGHESYADFFSGSSPNKKFNYIITKENIKKDWEITLEGVILDQQMNKISTFTYTTPVKRDDFGSLDFVLADNGILSIIYSAIVKPKKDDYTPILYTVLQTEKGKVTANPLAGLPSGKILGFAWTPQNDQLLFTAFLAKVKKKGLTAIISGSYDPGQKKSTGIREFEIKKLLLSQSKEMIKRVDEDGLTPDFVLRKDFTLSDGTRELVLEETSEFVASPFRTPTSTGSQIPYHHRQDLCLVRLDKANNPQWLNLATKNQDEMDYEIEVGIGCIADDKDNIHILFYDNKNNTEVDKPGPDWMYANKPKKSVIACVSVAPDGKIKKQMMDQLDTDWRLMYEKAFTNMKNKFFLMSINPKHAAYPEHFFKIASYKLTTFEIK